MTGTTTIKWTQNNNTPDLLSAKPKHQKNYWTSRKETKANTHTQNKKKRLRRRWWWAARAVVSTEREIVKRLEPEKKKIAWYPPVEMRRPTTGSSRGGGIIFVYGMIETWGGEGFFLLEGRKGKRRLGPGTSGRALSPLFLLQLTLDLLHRRHACQSFNQVRVPSVEPASLP
jgi:hypothetical protein